MDREPDNAEDRAFLILSMERRKGKRRMLPQSVKSRLKPLGPNGLPALKLDGQSRITCKIPAREQ